MAPEGALGQVRGVVFDMDGTLTVSALDFDAIRTECGLKEGQHLLEYLEMAPEPDRRRVQGILERHERRAARECRLRDGALDVLRSLSRRGLRLALLTRNSAESVRVVLERFCLQFDCWMSREHSAPKPAPDPVLRIAEQLGLSPAELLVVGDFLFDVYAGHAAGAFTAFVRMSSSTTCANCWTCCPAALPLRRCER